MILLTVIPAKAGTHPLRVAPGATGESWVPAFAGVTCSFGEGVSCAC